MSLSLIPIFKPGVHISNDGRRIEFTAENCQDLVTSYDPTLSEAPYVIGHPKQAAPAYGWSAKLTFKNGLVSSVSRQVNADFAEAVAKGAYKKRSASIYLPDSPGNPKPGHYYLRHVGFLGAVLPSIKGLPDVSFSAPIGGEHDFVEFSISEDELQTAQEPIMPTPDQILQNDNAEREKALIERERAIEAREKVIAAQRITDFSEREKTLAERESVLKQREDELSNKDRLSQQAEITNFSETLVKDGRLHPKMKTPLVNALMSIESSAVEPVSFSEGGATISQSAGEIIRSVLGAQKPFIDFAEKSEAGTGVTEEMSAEEIAAKARQYQAEQKKLGNIISTTDAVNHVKKEAKK